MKKIILGIMIGILVCGSIVYGVNIYSANDIEYTKSDGTKTNVNAVINDLYTTINNLSEKIESNGSNKTLAISYSGGGYIKKDLSASYTITITNDNYEELKVTSGTVDVVFNYIDGTTSSSISVNSGTFILIPENVKSIVCTSKSGVAGDDGWGGKWLYGTATIQLETSKSTSNNVIFNYSGGGYIKKDLSASSTTTVVNDNYKKIAVTSGTAGVVFNYIDGTASSSVSVTSGNTLQVPENVKSITYTSTSGVAGTDGYGGQWLYGTATIQLEK